MDTKIVLPRNSIEALVTVFTALAFVWVYNSSPVLVTTGTVGIVLAIPILLKKPEYGALFLVAILPFRDIHLISAIHFKRAVIWGLFIYALIRQTTSSQKLSSRNILVFNRVVVFFIGMIIVSLIKTASALYTTIYVTSAMLKSTILSDALNIVEGILILYIIYYSMETFQHIQRLIDVIIATSAIVALLGILQYYIGGPPAIVSFLYDPEYRFYGRATSIFSNPNGLGGFLAPIVVIAFVSFVWGATNNRKRLFLILPALILDSWALLLSFSRGAMLQVFFGITVMGYIYYTKVCNKKLSWKVILVAMTILGLVFTAIEYYDLYLRTRLSAYREQDYYAVLNWIKTTSDFQRKHAAIKAIQTFVKHPVLGIGYNLFSAKGIAGFEYFGLAVHNQYIKLLVEMGLLGFIPFITLLGIIVRAGMKIWDKRRERQAAQEVQTMMLLFLTGVSTIAFGYLFADALPFIPVTGFLWILSGAMFTLERQYNRKT